MPSRLFKKSLALSRSLFHLGAAQIYGFSRKLRQFCDFVDRKNTITGEIQVSLWCVKLCQRILGNFLHSLWLDVFSILWLFYRSLLWLWLLFQRVRMFGILRW